MGFEWRQQQSPLSHNSNIYGLPEITDLILNAFYDAAFVCVLLDGLTQFSVIMYVLLCACVCVRQNWDCECLRLYNGVMC